MNVVAESKKTAPWAGWVQEEKSQRGILENRKKLSWHFGQEHHGKSSILKRERKEKEKPQLVIRIRITG